MSSSAEAAAQFAGQTTAETTEPPALDWAEFAERPLPEGGDEAVSPQAELAGVLQRRHEDLSAARGEAAQAASGARDTVFELASLVGRLEQLIADSEQPLADSGQARLHRRLRILKEQMLQTLRDDAVEVRDPLGLPADEVADWVDPVGWRYGPQFTAETVAQTDEPAVFHRGAVVRLARVFMGSPEPEAAQKPEAAPEPEAALEPEPVLEPEAAQKPEPAPEPEAAQKPTETDRAPDSDPTTETDRAPDSDPTSETAGDPDSETDNDA
ncbi:hypothetical protein GTY65_29715 [Streptomyces sp. SID8379]|uniref:hypothetical protein n=1 Tax=unclassified Streptomyces TaxID=2593676 RepID=UPI0003779BC0|nr:MULTISPECIES: hypothetical protein [unclassified Streptomyces]MYW68223.1 hypothetical protein [Streptomyces sp. SID8379]